MTQTDENTAKGRKFQFTFLTFCRVLLAYALLLHLPVFFIGCTGVVETPDSHIYEMKIMAMAGQEEAGWNTADIFVFNNDRLGRLDSYQRFEIDRTTKVTAASRKGEKVIVAVLNSGRGPEEWSGINSLDAMSRVTMSLRDENPDRPVMSGSAEVSMGTDMECILPVVPLMSEVYVRSIRCDFSGRPYSGEEMKNVRVYLTNVNASAALMATEGFMPTEIVNGGMLSQTDLNNFVHPEMLVHTLGEPVGSDMEYAGLTLSCYPNDSAEASAGSPFTRLVVEGEIRGHKYYYPLNINRPTESDGGQGAGIGRNCRYVYDLTITRTGTDSPETLAAPDMVTVNCNIVPWEEMAEDEICF